VVKLGEYHQLKATKDSVQLKEEDIANAIEQLRHQHAIWEPVERQINSRDLVTMDIESTVGSLPFINQKDGEFEVVKESEFPVKGFAEELIGLKKGESKEFKLSFAADYQRTELAGKEVAFKVDIKEIKQEKLPEVDDDFARQVNPEFKTADELRFKVTENLKQNAEEKAKKDFEQKMIDEVVSLSEIEYPQIVIESQIDQLIRDQMRRWQLDEKGMDEYLKTINRTPEQLREELRPVAEKTVRQSLVLTEVARAEKIEISEADYKSEVENMTRDMTDDRKGKMVELLNLPQSQVSLASAIATRKTVQKLTEFAVGPILSEPKSENIETKESETKEKEAQV
jgi:trigger factor